MTRPTAPHIPNAADEVTTLTAFLDFYRAQLVDRCYGLSREQLDTPHPPTSLTLARLVSHMTFVEYVWYCYRFDGADMPEPLASFDFTAHPDAEMDHANGLSTDELMSQFKASVDDSRRRAAAASSLDQLAKRPNDNEDPWNLRWIMVHMIEEYARHCGHADLIREAIDGDVCD